MNKLIKNELKKLFGKKVIYILFIIAIGFTILANILYNMDITYDETENQKKEIEYYEQELRNIDYKNEEDNSYYIDTKTQYDLLKLKLNYESDSWQNNFIDSSDIVYETLMQINENTYGLNKNAQKLKESQSEYEKIKQRLNNGDWRTFVEEQLKETEEENEFYEDQLKNIQDKKTINDIKNSIELGKIKQQALEWRLEKNITYDGSFLSGKIEEYIYSAQSVQNLKDKENKTKEEEEEYKNSLKQMNTSKYYIENNIQIENENDARYILTNLTTEYGIFIVIFSIIVAGTIVSNEFQKGTIKLLLTRPYSRNKILLAKYIVSVICIILFIIAFIIAQYIVGGIVSGFDVFKIPVVEYNFATNSIVTIPVFQYLVIKVLCVLPMYLLLTTLAFTLSTISMNSAVAIAIPILGNMVAEIFNVFIERVKLLKYFVTANWDLSVYLFGGKGITDGLNFWISLIICVIYLVIMLFITFVVFKRRDIKNV